MGKCGYAKLARREDTCSKSPATGSGSFDSDRSRLSRPSHNVRWWFFRLLMASPICAVLPIPSAFGGRRVVSMNALIWRCRVNCPGNPALGLRCGSPFSFPCRHFVPGKRKRGLISRSLLSPRRLSQADRNCQSGRHIVLLPGISGQAPETEVYVSVENRDLSEGPPVTKVISGFGEASANIVTTESFVTSRF